MEKDLWFNWAPHNNQAMAYNVNRAPQQNQQVQVNAGPVRTGGTTGGATLNTGVVPGRTTGQIVYTYCTKCVSGSARGNRVTNGDCTTLGPGWMNADPNNTGTWIDPCATPPPRPVNGCTDPLADNYNALATADDGSCSYAVSGCMDPLADNFDPSATVDDGLCTYAPVLEDDCYDCASQTMARVPRGSCVDGKDIMSAPVDPTTGLSKNPCPVDVMGCMDATASNYDPTATIDDGTCIPMIDTPLPPDDDDETEIVEELSEPKTAGLGDNKMILYLMGGIIAYLLLSRNKND